MHCLRLEISIILGSKHSKHSFLGQFGVELTVVVSAEKNNDKAFRFVFLCLVKNPSDEEPSL